MKIEWLYNKIIKNCFVSEKEINNFYLLSIYYYAKCQALSYAIKMCVVLLKIVLSFIPEIENKIFVSKKKKRFLFLKTLNKMQIIVSVRRNIFFSSFHQKSLP